MKTQNEIDTDLLSIRAARTGDNTISVRLTAAKLTDATEPLMAQAIALLRRVFSESDGNARSLNVTVTAPR